MLGQLSRFDPRPDNGVAERSEQGSENGLAFLTTHTDNHPLGVTEDLNRLTQTQILRRTSEDDVSAVGYWSERLFKLAETAHRHLGRDQ